VKVAGADGCRGGWVAVVLEDGRFSSARVVRSIGEVLVDGELDVVAVDMPIGLAVEPPRPADSAAKKFLAPYGSRVFYAPSLAAVATETFAEARALQASLSAQAYALAAKIREVEEARDERVIEVHPEVSFAALAGAPVAASKRTWNGLHERLALLSGAGIELPPRLDGEAAPDDVVDAAVAAWSAVRYARDAAEPLPEGHRNRIGAIWY
jgi:predicted RNase H-like nuclease